MPFWGKYEVRAMVRDYFMRTKGPRPTFHSCRRGPQAPEGQDGLELLHLAKANTDCNVIFSLWTKDHFSIQRKMSKF